MAAIAHAFAEQNAAQTTTSTAYTDITGASIASGNFVAGKKYLVFITAQVSGAASAAYAFIRALHGTTAFAESEMIGRSVSAGETFTYGWFTVWTAVSGEGIKLQFKTVGANTIKADQVSLLAINLSDDLTEGTDWHFKEDGIDLALGTTFSDGADVTFTPGTAGQDWLTLTMAQIDATSATLSSISRHNRDADASVVPEARLEVDASSQPIYTLARAYSLTAASHTFKEQSSATGTAHTRLHSSLFVLNLAKFKRAAVAFNIADIALSATNYATELATLSITPDVAGDVWIGAYWGFDRQNTGREGEFRVQVDNADQPPGQTTDNYQFDAGTDATDEQPLVLSTLKNLTAAVHTIDLDASADSATATPAGQHRTLWAVTMELAGAVEITGSLAQTLGALVLSAAATVAIAGQATPTLAAVTLAANATVEIQGTASPPLGALTLSASGTVEDAAISGSLDQTLGALTAAGTGTVAVVGQASQTLGALTADADGTVEVRGSTSATLGALTASGLGAVEVQGAVASTLGAVTASSDGTVAVVGTTSQTLGALTVDAQGVVGDPPVEGTLASTLGAMTLAGSGSVEVRGQASATLGALSAVGTGIVETHGVTSASLGELSLAGTGGVEVRGIATPALGALTSSAQGGVLVTGGTLEQTLGALTLVASDAPPWTSSAKPGEQYTAKLLGIGFSGTSIAAGATKTSIAGSGTGTEI